MTKLTWTLAALSALGGVAQADEERSPATADVMSVSRGSHRGVAQDYLVAPAGGELTSSMKFLMTEPSLGGEAMKFSDLALFNVGGRWSFFSKLELSLEASFLAKQPSFTDEKPWQSVGGAIRTPIGKRAALQISAAGGHLIGHEGMWTKEALLLQWRQEIAEDIMQFDITAGVDGVSLSAPRASSAFITEVAFMTSALFREPSGHWGGWVGLGYAVPVAFRGQDPTTGMSVDPQPRLDFRIGTVLSLVKNWDLFAELAIVDRGDMEDPATRLPIMDGGFDQKQVMLGVTRHIDGKRRRSGDNDDNHAMRLR
ncbi:MAG: hypothetical protein M4D80_12255 [Myxococcota bacterium]|nr:hypothetical protein [Myxococcota bacterium]